MSSEHVVHAVHPEPLVMKYVRATFRKGAVNEMSPPPICNDDRPLVSVVKQIPCYIVAPYDL